MFDMGFAELAIIGVVGLLVIGPERLPSAVRTASAWLNRIKRGFSDIKREVAQELHNDEVLQDLRKTGQGFKSEAESLTGDMRKIVNPLPQPGMVDDAVKETASTENTVPADGVVTDTEKVPHND